MVIKRKIQFPPFFQPKTQRLGMGSRYESYHILATIYVLRLAIAKKGELSRHQLMEFFEGDLGKMTGLAEIEYDERGSYIDLFELDDAENPKHRITKEKLLGQMRQRLTQLISEGCSVSEPLFINLGLLAKALRLTETEQEILVLRLFIPLLEDYRLTMVEHCDDCSWLKLVDYLHVMTLRPRSDIENALRPSGQLVQMGWLKISSKISDFEDKLQLAEGLLDILQRDYANEDELFAHFFKETSSTTLVLADYAHLSKDIALLVPYLQTAQAQLKTGVNILIYGPPGVGKTQFAKLLAQTLETPLYEVLCADKEGKVLRGSARFAACTLSQKLLSQNSTASLLLFDEAEDVFPSRYSIFFGEDDEDNYQTSGCNQGDKAWINHQLESNPVPMIWITNRVDHMDKAFLRRFSYSVEIDKMPITIRRRIVNKYVKGLKVSTEWRENLVNQIHLTPAQIEQACSIAKATKQRAPGQSEQIAEHVLEASAHLLKQPRNRKHISWTHYDRAFTNTDMDLASVIVGLKHNPCGNFCFYGAPGTGKTALARHIADSISLPLHIKRASDLLDKYVGESEKNIAEMFTEAEKQGAILLLDEADSLLSDRSHARQHWEISQVNEMLTQMENFQGIFICTTNLMDKLDTASLRRFDFKVKFDYLKPEQRWALFLQESKRLGTKLPSNANALSVLEQQIYALTQLTPGDFAVVSRQVAVLGKTPKPESIIAVLTQECKAKGETFSKIGFVH